MAGQWRGWIVGLLALLSAALGTPLAAQTTPTVAPLAPLAHWVGEWVGNFEIGSGRKMTVIRTYEWSFDKRVLIGRSFAEVGGRRVQSRETVYFWNADSARIEFTDFIDQGGFGAGSLEPRDGKLYMEAKVIGNPQHPSWRAWMTETPDQQVIRVEALRDGKWVDFGTYPYQRKP